MLDDMMLVTSELAAATLHMAWTEGIVERNVLTYVMGKVPAIYRGYH